MDKKNLLTRIASALILGPMALFAVYYGQYYFYTLVVLISWFSIFEMGRMFRNQGQDPINLLLYIYVPINHFFMMRAEFERVFIFFLIFAIIQYLIELFRNMGSENANNGSTHFISVYAILFPSALLAIREIGADLFMLSYLDASYFIFLILIGIWACDTFAYIGGVTLGKHKLYPRVSPKKSIEGAIFGFIGALATAYVFHLTLLASLPTYFVILIGIIIGVFGQLGDLIESLMKRDAGVKDSGDTIPGHGGVLDRIDSIIYVSPIVFFTIYFIYIY